MLAGHYAAALMGKAVLATDVGGTPEIVAHRYSALLVRPRDVRALRAGLEELLADPALRRQLGEAARSETLARFDWPKSAAQFLEVARGLVTDHAGDGSGAVSTSSKIDS